MIATSGEYLWQLNMQKAIFTALVLGYTCCESCCSQTRHHAEKLLDV